MALAWQLLAGVVLFLLAILSGSEVQGTNFVSIALLLTVSQILFLETVYVAYPSNLVDLTYNGTHTFYKTSVSQGAELKFFNQVDGLDCDRSKEMLCWTDQKLNVVRYK